MKILHPVESRTNSVALGLLDCSWLAVMRVQTLKNGMKRSGSRGIFKMQGKKGLKQALEWYDGGLGFAKTKFHFEQNKID